MNTELIKEAIDLFERAYDDAVMEGDAGDPEVVVDYIEAQEPRYDGIPEEAIDLAKRYARANKVPEEHRLAVD